MNFNKLFSVRRNKRVKLSECDPDFTAKFNQRSDIEVALQSNISRLVELQYLLFAENKHALLIVLQSMDAGGKDGTIRQVMSNVDPQSCKVTAFKTPSTKEMAHDFLWRIHKAIPARGEIMIFNRSHYEDVLVPRVHKLISREILLKRYDQINDFEKMLSENNVKILKFFLHISKDEQKKRLQSRLENRDKNWKVDPSDFEDRKLWNKYQEAYEELLGRCSTKWASWFIIPANKKWFRNLVISKIITEELEKLQMKYPPPRCDLSKIIIK